MNPCTLEEVRAAKPHALEIFGAFEELTGVGITRVGEGYGLKVNFSREPSTDEPLPNEVDGVPVRIEVVGSIRSKTETDGPVT